MGRVGSVAKYEFHMELLDELGAVNCRIQRLAESKESKRPNNVSQKRRNEIRDNEPIKQLNWMAYAQVFEV